jgi:hypothetical protein
MLLAVVAIAISGSGRHQRAASAPPLPNPVLYLVRTEFYQANGKNFIRYQYDVFNKDEYPAEMFAASPDLPPCGKNTNASRTWIDFLEYPSGKRLYGFCAFGKPADLGSIWFALEEGQLPPSYVYIEMTDRKPTPSTNRIWLTPRCSGPPRNNYLPSRRQRVSSYCSPKCLF